MTTLAILAGGASRRMGSDKARQRIGGRPQLERLAGLGAGLGLDLVICGRSQPLDWVGPEARFILDAVPGEGPLRGLEAALGHSHEVLLLPCDLPLLTADDLRWLLAQDSGADGVVAVVDGELQPLFARYRATCLPRIREALAHGRRSPRRLIEDGAFVRCTVPPEMVQRLGDADTPEDWHRLTGGQ